jgi:lipopolysaccharide export system protein LptA
MAIARRPLSLVLVVLGAGVAALFGEGLSARAAPLAMVEGQALDVSADHLDVDVERGTAVLRGNVTAKVGDLEVRCPTLELGYDQSPRVKWARASEGVTARFKGVEASSRSADLDAKGKLLTLHGGVRLARGSGWITAEQATIDVATGKVSLQEVKGSIPVDAAHPH